jgi:hypothetical protein
MCLPNRCLATIGGYTDRPTGSPLIRHGLHRKRHVQLFFYYCVCICSGDKFLPSRCLATCKHRLVGGINGVRLSYGLRCHDIHTKFHKHWFRHSKVNGRIHRHTNSVVIAISQFLFFQKKESRLKCTGRARRMWRDNIKMDLTDTGYECVQYTVLAQYRFGLVAFNVSDYTCAAVTANGQPTGSDSVCSPALGLSHAVQCTCVIDISTA